MFTFSTYLLMIAIISILSSPPLEEKIENSKARDHRSPFVEGVSVVSITAEA